MAEARGNVWILRRESSSFLQDGNRIVVTFELKENLRSQLQRRKSFRASCGGSVELSERLVVFLRPRKRECARHAGLRIIWLCCEVSRELRSRAVVLLLGHQALRESEVRLIVATI